MARGAGGGKTRRDVIGILRTGEIGRMAGIAIRRNGVEVVVDVAGSAGHGDVSAGKREDRDRVIEGGSGPVAGVVALRAVGGKASRDMVRVGGALQIRLMATDTGGRCACELPADVAGRAGQCGMGAGEGEITECGMVELRAQPVIHRMADRAVQREARLLMRWVLRGLKIGPVADDALRAHPREDSIRTTLMAALALYPRMRAQKREAIRMVERTDLAGRRPASYGMALFAPGTHLRAMQVGMAARTVMRSIPEDLAYMAAAAGYVRMHVAQGISGLGIVIELRMSAGRRPRRGCVTRFAGNGKRPVRVAGAVGLLRCILLRSGRCAAEPGCYQDGREPRRVLQMPES